MGVFQETLISADRSTPAQDADADGLFDSWEISVAGDTDTFESNLFDSQIDSDGDGVSDGEEYLMRTNPLEFDSFLSDIEVSESAEYMRLRWNSQKGVFYSLQKSSDLSEWSPSIGTYLGNGELIELNTPIVEDKEFIRLSIPTREGALWTLAALS